MFLLTSDWQMSLSNLEYCRIAHQQELEIIKEFGVSVHLDLGDIKDAYNPIDGRVIDFARERAHNLVEELSLNTKNSPIIVRLLGNHDRYGQTDTSGNWLEMLGGGISEPCVGATDRCLLFCLPYRKLEVDILADVKRIESLRQHYQNDSRRKVLLFHNEIRGASWNNVRSEVSKGCLTLKKLHTSAYTRCFGGHIHKTQFLSKNTMYVGNPFATDKGEIDQQKGFWLWDDERDELKFIPSCVPGMFSWDYIKQSKTRDLPKGTRVFASVRCNAQHNYHARIAKLTAKIEKELPQCQVHVQPKFVTKTGTNEVVVDPASSDAEKVRNYVSATITEELLPRRAELVEYLLATLGRIEGKSSSRHSGKITFDSVEAKNVLSFEKLNFDYRNRGILLVKGDNQDCARFNSIGAGKSNFLSMPSIACFGQTFKKQKADAWASDKNKKKSKIVFRLHDDAGHRVKIVRGRRPNCLQMWLNGRDVSSGLNSNSKKSTQGQIERFIGYTYDTFYKSVYIDQSLSNGFLSGTNMTRSVLIQEFLNLERFEEARKLVHEDVTSLITQMDEVSATMHSSQEELDDLLSSIQDREKIDLSILNGLKKQVSVAQKRLGAFEKQNQKTARSLEKRCTHANETRRQMDFARERAATKIANLSSEIASLTKQFHNKDKITVCDKCGRPLDLDVREEVLAKLSAKIDSTKYELQQWKKKRIKFTERFVASRKIADRLSKSLENLQTHQRKLENDVASATSALQVIEEKAKLFQSIEHKQKSRVVRLRRILHSAETAYKNMEAECSFLHYAKETFNHSGLPAFLCNLTVPVLNHAAARYSQLFVDGEIQVVFELEENRIVPQIINAHGGLSLDAQSTGEKAWAAIITSFALREISHPTNLLILDEPGHGLDEESARTFGKNLVKLQNLFETVLVVTHNPFIQAALEGEASATVVKQNKCSVLHIMNAKGTKAI